MPTIDIPLIYLMFFKNHLAAALILEIIFLGGTLLFSDGFMRKLFSVCMITYGAIAAIALYALLSRGLI